MLAVDDMRRPFMLAFQLPGGDQGGQLDQFSIQRRFEAHVAPQVRGPLRQLRTMQQRQPWATHDAPALGDGVINRLVFGG